MKWRKNELKKWRERERTRKEGKIKVEEKMNGRKEDKMKEMNRKRKKGGGDECNWSAVSTSS